MPGVPGPQGPQGREGAKGKIGDNGLQGMQGPRGDRGHEGPPGKGGPPGIKGVKGEPGPAGMKGEPGIVGNQGRKGEKGESANASQESAVPQTNWKQCVWKSNIPIDNGRVKVSKETRTVSTHMKGKQTGVKRPGKMQAFAEIKIQQQSKDYNSLHPFSLNLTLIDSGASWVRKMTPTDPKGLVIT